MTEDSSGTAQRPQSGWVQSCPSCKERTPFHDDYQQCIKCCNKVDAPHKNEMKNMTDVEQVRSDVINAARGMVRNWADAQGVG